MMLSPSDSDRGDHLHVYVWILFMSEFQISRHFVKCHLFKIHATANVPEILRLIKFCQEQFVFAPSRNKLGTLQII